MAYSSDEDYCEECGTELEWDEWTYSYYCPDDFCNLHLVRIY